jgi:branched-chain amino acid transport system substrate-binding protein
LRYSRLLTLGCVVAATTTGLAACGGDDNNSSGGGGGGGSSSSGSGELHIYSSLNLEGASRGQNQAVVNGIKLALEQAGGKAGGHPIKYISLSDASAQAGNWTPELTSANARRAAQDDKTAVYIGEFNSGASAVSIPILNEGGVPQISPSNTGVGLTSDEEGAAPGEPDKYYPTGKRTFARIVPKDTIQGAALATVAKQDGCTNVALTNDKEVYGAGLATNVSASLKAQGVKLAFNQGIDPKAPNYRALASRAKAAGADCFIFSGVTANNGVQIFKDFAAALPNAKLYGPDGVAEAAFTDPKEGGLPTNVAARTTVTVAALDPDSYPPEGQKFFQQYTAKYGDRTPDPYAVYGYEAMSLALDSINRAGSGDKKDILKALYATKDRKSVLGTYSIDKNGDTSLTDYGAYKIKDGQLSFDKLIKAKPAG